MSLVRSRERRTTNSESRVAHILWNTYTCTPHRDAPRVWRRRGRSGDRLSEGHPEHTRICADALGIFVRERAPTRFRNAPALTSSTCWSSCRRRRLNSAARAIMRAGDGSELHDRNSGRSGNSTPARFCAPYSSSALTVNTFGPFRHRNALPPTAGLVDLDVVGGRAAGNASLLESQR